MRKLTKAEEWTVVCSQCGIAFRLDKAPWCRHEFPYGQSKLCPNGHCIYLRNFDSFSESTYNTEKFRPATEKERKLGFAFMLREEFGGKKKL